MSEAPEKIWYDPQAGFADEKQQYPEDTPYVRVDLVDELVEALESILTNSEFRDEYHGGNAPGHCHIVEGKWDRDGRTCEWCLAWEKAKAALAKVRGEKNE